ERRRSARRSEGGAQRRDRLKATERRRGARGLEVGPGRAARRGEGRSPKSKCPLQWRRRALSCERREEEARLAEEEVQWPGDFSFCIQVTKPIVVGRGHWDPRQLPVP
uniref:Uncharacterized protein n=1 Tax=Mustela putorius furo TaxID=9669 RepID=M3Z356_MUSPF